MTEPDKESTDEQLSEAVVEAMLAGAEQADTGYDEGGLMIGVRADEVKARRDVIGRDKVTVYQAGAQGRGREPLPLPLTREELDPIKHTFVAPAGFAELSLARRLLIIRVGARRGGRTAAARLLLDHGASVVKVLSHDVALRRITTKHLEPQVGYLLPNAGAVVLEDLTDFEIERLRKCLGDLDSRLVLTVDPKARLPEAVIADYTVALGDPPAAAEVLASHLRRHLHQHDTDGTRAAEILDDPLVLEMLADFADRDDRVRQAASLARTLAGDEQAGNLDLERIRRQRKQLNNATFETWFDRLEPSSRCFAISLATLPGRSYEVVSDAAAQLERALMPPAQPTPGEPPPDPFRNRRTMLLEAVQARVTNQPVRTRYGTTPMEVVHFGDRSLPQQVLTGVWTEYAEARTTLLEWLRNLARHPVQSVREGAADAVGVFAVQAFDYVRRYVIGPWAQSENSLDRQAAAAALQIPARAVAVSQALRSLLYEWHLDRSDVPFRITATRAYGHLGLRDLDTSLDAFAHLATDPNLALVLASSITSLIVRGDEQLTLAILERLRLWTTRPAPAIDPPKESLRARRDRTPQEKADDQRARLFVAYSAFMYAATQAQMRDPVGTHAGAAAWPGLLWRSDTSPAIAEAMATLWAEAVVHPIAREAAQEALTAWAVVVDEDPAGREALAVLLTRVGRTNRRVQSTIQQLARRWHSEWTARDAAEAVLKKLDQEGGDDDGK